MSSLVHKLRAIAIDILGGLLILASVLFGWIPGPGGIPLFLGGLALLAINHEWARRLLKKAKGEGGSLLNKLFGDHPALKFILDTISVLLLGLAIFLLYQYSHNLIRSLAIVALVAAVSLFLGNRKRLQRLIDYFSKRK